MSNTQTPQGPKINTVPKVENPDRGKVRAKNIYEEPDTGDYDIDENLKAELAEAGLDYKYIDFKQARLNGGRSRSGWIIYRRESEDPRTQGIKALADPDGLVRNGSLVLAVKTRQNADRQRKRKEDQNRTLRRYTEHAKAELESDVRNKLGGNTRIISGYDKNR